MGKSSTLPFIVSESRAMAPLDSIHCDLWRPSPVISVQGFRYYVIFIDNYSRYSWIYPLKQNSGFYYVLVAF